jgi:hypothetical protein
MYVCVCVCVCVSACVSGYLLSGGDGIEGIKSFLRQNVCSNPFLTISVEVDLATVFSLTDPTKDIVWRCNAVVTAMQGAPFVNDIILCGGCLSFWRLAGLVQISVCDMGCRV